MHYCTHLPKILSKFIHSWWLILSTTFTQLHNTKADRQQSKQSRETKCILITTVSTPLLLLLLRPWRCISWLWSGTFICRVSSSSECRYFVSGTPFTDVASTLWMWLSTGQLVNTGRLARNVRKSTLGRCWCLPHCLTCWLGSRLDRNVSCHGPVEVRFQICPWQQPANINVKSRSQQQAGWRMPFTQACICKHRQCTVTLSSG